MKLHTKYQRPGPCSFRQEDFSSLPMGAYVKKIDLSVKKDQSLLKVIIFQTLLGPCPQCCIGSGEEDF